MVEADMAVTLGLSDEDDQVDHIGSYKEEQFSKLQCAYEERREKKGQEKELCSAEDHEKQERDEGSKGKLICVQCENESPEGTLPSFVFLPISGAL